MKNKHTHSVSIYLAVAVFFSVLSCQKKTPVKSDPLDLSAIDSTVRPQDDFFDFANGTWIKNIKIPPSESSWGSFTILRDNVVGQIHTILDSASKISQPEMGSVSQKVGDLYASAMDSAGVEKLGFDPIKPYLQRISSIKDIHGLLDEISVEYKEGLNPFFNFYAAADDKNSDWEMAHFDQGGLGLPNRDYYFRQDSSTIKIRKAYVDYVTTILNMIGDNKNMAAKEANSIFQLETHMASASKSPQDLRDPIANYHKMLVRELDKEMPSLYWSELLKAMNINEDTVLVGQPEFYKNLAGLILKSPISDLKNYLRFHMASYFAPYLSNDFVSARFKFSQYLSGQKEMQPRWKRMSHIVDQMLGDALGQLYVSRYFPPAAKQRMDQLVDNLEQAYAEHIQALDWMSDSTKKKALEKLHAIVKKIGYPDKWKDYSSVHIHRDSLISNITQCGIFDYNFNVNKIGKPVDRSEWFMTPPTVNAYYNPTSNDINFPAGILQPPFFFANGDDAVNYGAIGMVIGHEMTHGFDDEGRQFDARGNLENWWTPADAAKFKQKTDLVVKQYDQFTVLDSLHVNGKLTLGENIADIGGLSIAYAAFKKTAQGQSTEKVDGLTPDQRFFMSLAQVWRMVTRPERERSLILIDPHSPPKYRVNGPVSNLDAFYTAFDVKPGDKLYRPDSIRVHIW